MPDRMWGKANSPQSLASFGFGEFLVRGARSTNAAPTCDTKNAKDSMWPCTSWSRRDQRFTSTPVAASFDHFWQLDRFWCSTRHTLRNIPTKTALEHSQGFTQSGTPGSPGASSLCSTPTCSPSFGLRAKPALALSSRYDCLGIMFLARQVVDVVTRVHADVALDVAA